MTDTTLFYPLFISQIFLLSYYFPTVILKRFDFIHNKFTANDYPNLYPKPKKYYQNLRRGFILMNSVIFLNGFILLYAIYTGKFTTDGRIEQMLPWAYFMVQLVPAILGDYIGLKQFKLMREKDERSNRVADLQPRKLTDLVTANLLYTAIAAYLFCCLFVLYLYDFDFSLNGRAVLNILILLAGNLFFAFIMRLQISGKKQDPYQASKDRIRQIQIISKSLLYLSIAMSFYIAIVVYRDVTIVQDASASLMSIFCQVIAIISPGIPLHSYKIEDLDFEVYKKDAHA